MQGTVVAVSVEGELEDRFDEILSNEALAFVAQLHEQFDGRRRELLLARGVRQARLDAGELPGFLPETAGIRESEWQIDPVPPGLRDRRVEITGPVDRKMVINALNSGARMFMADFEDANSPTWHNCVAGQVNLADAIRGTIDHVGPNGKHYRLADETATLLVRPRGWHLEEQHVTIEGQAISASLFDFGLFVFHNARALIDRGWGPWLYLPKLESHLEARLWNDVFTFAESELALERGAIRATVLIETILAAFEMDEILWELRDHAAGLNAGRWDYIFSVIKRLTTSATAPLPDRSQVTMTVPFMRSYSDLLVQTCHRRGAHAMGGMAAFIPTRHDAEVNERALGSVRADKQREATAGFDGTWVAHPGLVPIAFEEFDRVLGDHPNQLGQMRPDVAVVAEDLLDVAVPGGAVTEAGLRSNIEVGIGYLAAWLGGNGAVALNNLMEDAATAEISRSQVWQWVHRSVQLDDGRAVTEDLVRMTIIEVCTALQRELGEDAYVAGRYDDAARLFGRVALDQPFHEFLTTVAYRELTQS